MHIIEQELIAQKNSEHAKLLSRFFKTGKGEYGEGDKFLGLPVPIVRKTIKPYIKTITVEEIVTLLHSQWHEVRLAACILFRLLHEQAVIKKNMSLEKKIYQAYLNNTRYINNWDLVDVSAGEIVGKHIVMYGNTRMLTQLSTSPSVWRRRIAVIASSAYIQKGDPNITIDICKKLLTDKHDLIHKACGWMLREVGKQCSQKTLNTFLDKYAQDMPRTMLRYALEKHSKKDQAKYMTQTRKTMS